MSDLGDLVGYGFSLDEDGNLVLSDDAYCSTDLLVRGDCQVGGNAVIAGGVSIGGEVKSFAGSLEYITAVIHDTDATGRYAHFVAPFGGSIVAMRGILWSAAGTGTLQIRPLIETVIMSSLNIAYLDSDVEGTIVVSDPVAIDYARFNEGDDIYLHEHDAATGGPTVGLVLTLRRTQEEV